eukprot:2980090-Pyramimonas_sp.AAC.1
MYSLFTCASWSCFLKRSRSVVSVHMAASAALSACSRANHVRGGGIFRDSHPITREEEAYSGTRTRSHDVYDPMKHVYDPLRHVYDPLKHVYDPLRHVHDPLKHVYDPPKHAYDPLKHVYDPLKHVYVKRTNLESPSGQQSVHCGRQQSVHCVKPSVYSDEVGTEYVL